MKSTSKLLQITGAAVCCLSFSTAYAATPVETQHAAALLTFSSADSDRGQVNNATGFGMIYGSSLTDLLGSGYGYEISLNGETFETRQDGFTDYYRYGATGSLTAEMGSWENGRSFVMGGLGLAYNDVFPDKEDAWSALLEVGLGFKVGLSSPGAVALRGEARVVYDTFFDNYLDYRIGLGIQVELQPRGGSMNAPARRNVKVVDDAN